MVSTATITNVGAVAGGLVAGRFLAMNVPVSADLKPYLTIAAGLILASTATGLPRSIGVGIAAGGALDLATRFLPLPV